MSKGGPDGLFRRRYLGERALIGAQMKIMGRRLDVVMSRLPDRIKGQVAEVVAITPPLPEVADRLLDIIELCSMPGGIDGTVLGFECTHKNMELRR